MTVMLALPCAGKLGNCPKNVKRFRFTCLYCRWRRQYYGNFSRPPFWIQYTFKSVFRTFLTYRYVKNGLVYEDKHGRLLRVTSRHTLKIDPRGHFTSLRCATISVLDEIMSVTKASKPLSEFCEFLACYPTI